MICYYLLLKDLSFLFLTDGKMIVSDLRLFTETFDIIKNHFISNNIIAENSGLDLDEITDVIMSADYIRSYYYYNIMTYFFEFKVSRPMDSLSFSVNCIDCPDKNKFEFPDFGATFDLFTESRRQIKLNSFVSFTFTGNYSWKYIPQVRGIIDAEGYLPLFNDAGEEKSVIPPDVKIYSVDDFKKALDPVKYCQSLKIIRIEK